MTADERLAHLAEHGIGCPQAVKLGGPAAVEAWCEQQELTLEAQLAAEAAADAEAEAVAEAEAAERDAKDAERNAAMEAEAEAAAEAGDVALTGSDPEAPEGTHGAFTVEALEHILARLDALDSAVDALAASGPPVEAVEAVAATPEPKKKGKGKGKK